jgi:hypothetical protein
MKLLLAATVMLFATAPLKAQDASMPTFVSGTCDPTSGVSINDDNSTFGCDTAVVSRTARGVMIQFTDKSGDDGRILGFAGTIEGRQGFGADPVQMMAVERVYLGGNVNPLPARRGTCILNWTGLQRTGGTISSVVCGAVLAAEGSNIKATVILKAR